MRLKKQIMQCFIFLFICTGFQVLAEDQDFDQVQIQSTKISDHVYMLTGKGGNIGVYIGSDGILLIDDQF
ncbi:MAG: MBL fold metallo-hydrolase, partial [Chlamydiota bacterium]|nr:MBL fold metallo-hydrolase [Chlamydiota bacterium]